MNSCVRCGTSGPTGESSHGVDEALAADHRRVSPVRMAQRVEHGQRRVLALLLGQRPQLVLEAMQPLPVSPDALHRVAGRLDPVDEGVERDAVVVVMVEHVERLDLAVGLVR